MDEFISEPIQPLRGAFDTVAMTTALPGLPRGFKWRDATFQVVEPLETWKHSSREGGQAGGELYLRRHYHRLRMSDESLWTVYFVRQTPRSGNPKRRWFLYSVEHGRESRDLP